MNPAIFAGNFIIFRYCALEIPADNRPVRRHGGIFFVALVPFFPSNAWRFHLFHVTLRQIMRTGFDNIRKNNNRSFAYRLTWRIVLAQFITLGLTSGLICLIAMIFLESETTDKYQSHLENSKENMRRVLSDVYVATVNTAPVVEQHLDDPEEVRHILERMVTLNPLIRGVGVSYAEGCLSKSAPACQPYSFRTLSGAILTRDLAQLSPDYLSQQWFRKALSASEGFWSEPFFDKNDSLMPLVAYLQPLRDGQGRTVAVLGADLSLHRMRQMLRELDENIYQTEWRRTSYGEHQDRQKRQNHQHRRLTTTFAVARDGTFVVHPDTIQVLRGNILDEVRATPDSLDDRLARDMLAGRSSAEVRESGYDVSVTIHDKDYTVLFTPVPYVNWSLGIAVPSLSINFIGIALTASLALLIIIALTVLFIVCRITIKRTARPLTKLAETANEVAKGNFDTVLPVTKRHDEIRLLRDSLEEMQISLAVYIEELTNTTASKAAIENELRIAHDIQMSMLPKTFPAPPEHPEIDIYGILTPAKGIGGDLFDFFIRNDRLFFCIGDVSGKGMPAALIMSTTRSLFHNISYHLSEPDKIMQELNKAQTDGNETNMFVTLFVGMLNLSTGRLMYCNAGHDAPMLIGQTMETLACDPNLPIGVESGWKYSLQHTTIEPQTTIFLFTDGLNEAENTRQELFGDARVRNVARLAVSRGQRQPRQVIDSMTEAVSQFVGDAEQSDDLTMLAIQFIEPTKTK